jgi:DNA-directed RNA polymerase I subunit RPA2
LQKAITGVSSEFTRSFESFLSTGNLPSTSGLALPQQNGFAIIADRINQLRFLTNFRAIHRGSFFQSMRTTDVRKLRPEAWGFICPVHTPDGGPCGLLNHMTAACCVVADDRADRVQVIHLLEELGCVLLDDMVLHWPHGVCAVRVRARKYANEVFV